MARAAPRFPHHLVPRLREALADSPAVLVHGPRQCGKTTLARLVGEPRGYRYVSFDDEAVATAATADPVGFVSDLPARTILDEVKRVPEIFTSLERVFLLKRLPDWHANRLSRLVKRPTLHVGDTGVACAPLGVDAGRLTVDRPLLGALLEKFVFQELRRQVSWLPEPVEFFHFRDRDDFEVDIVLEQGALAVAGVEMKAAATVKDADLRGLRKLRAVAGKRFVAGVVLYDGSAGIAFGDGLFAVPVRKLWEAA